MSQIPIPTALKPLFLAKSWLYALAALFAGAVFVLGFAPVSFWFAPLMAVLVLFALLEKASPRQGFWLGFAFGVGQFGVGVSWVYNSLSLFGGLIGPIAGVVTAVFVLLLSLYPATLTLLYRKLVRPRQAPMLMRLLLFIALWVLWEYLRAWLFGGFPWLNIGVAQFNGPMLGWLPLVGEFGTALVALLFAALLFQAVVWLKVQRSAGALAIRAAIPIVVALALAAVLVLVSWFADQYRFTQPNGDPVQAAVVQANIPQMQRFEAEVFEQTLSIYFSLTEQVAEADLVVWPETAIPQILTFLPELHTQLRQLAERHDSSMLVGAFTESQGDYFNALVGVPDQVGTYHKQHLVPFGEYFPLRGVVERFPGIYEVPMSDLTPGTGPGLVRVDGVPVGASICYEMDFARDIRPALPKAEYLVTVSNDSWFGARAARQHLEIAQARAYEFRRPMVRATNTGVSALLDHRGAVLNAIEWDVRGVASAEFSPRTGSTPVMYYGAAPAVIAALLIGLWFIWRYRRTPRRV